MRCVLAAVSAATVLVAGDTTQFPFYHQRLRWTACEAESLAAVGAECADVVVPLDYRDPHGRTMTVAISRVRATDPDRRRGVLLSNPGGPGASGLDSVGLLGDVLSPDVLAQYDLIGMAPAGSAHSMRPGRAMIRSAGVSASEFTHEVALARDMANTCSKNDPEKLLRLTTRNTARDMDLVRSVLGEETISYFGLSYGTYLGAVFTQMFPERSDRIVLDSAIDPDRYWTGLVRDWGPADEAALDEWANRIAQQDRRYHLGDTAQRVRMLVEDLIHRAARRPIVIDGYRIDDHLLPFLLHNLLRSHRLDDTLAATVRELLDAAEGRPASTAQASGLADTLAALRNSENSALAVIACGDVGAPTDPARYRRNIEQARTTEPVFGAPAANIQPCAFWPRPLEPPTIVRNTVPALILQATGDIRTPYHHGLALHRAMAGSRLVTLQDVRIHLTFRPDLSACVNDTINDYLGTGRLPSTDITCRADLDTGL